MPHFIRKQPDNRMLALLKEANDTQQEPKKVTSPLPKIKLLVQKPDASKPLDWLSAYERHAG